VSNSSSKGLKNSIGFSGIDIPAIEIFPLDESSFILGVFIVASIDNDIYNLGI
jgi:hypothetical protein